MRTAKITHLSDIVNKCEKVYFLPQRIQPPHIGHIQMLETAGNESDHFIIGIGSINKQDQKNPYTADERKLMIEKSLYDKGINNFSIIYIPDFDHDEDWFNYIVEKTGINGNTTVVSGNDHVKEIFENKGFSVINSFRLADHNSFDICATQLREMIANNDYTWEKYAATGTKYFFNKFGGAERIKRYIKTNSEVETNGRT